MTVEQFKRILAKGHLYQSLYHFTDSANRASIAEHGLLSKQLAAERGIAIAVLGGNQWSQDADAYKGLSDYVNLCFTRQHPMCHVAHVEGRIPNPQYLRVNPDVLYIDGVKITLDVANKVGVELLDVEDGLGRIDTEVLYTRTNWRDADIHSRLSQVEKYEILVPRMVPLALINL